MGGLADRTRVARTDSGRVRPEAAQGLTGANVCNEPIAAVGVMASLFR